MRHAILMTVYKDVNLVNRVLKTYPNDFDIYIHIDKKSNIKESDIKSEHRTVIIKKYEINWGGYHHLLAFKSLLDIAYQNDYDYYHLTTGQDAMVQTKEQLENYISKFENGICFFETYRVPAKQYPFWESGWGILDYYMFTDLLDYSLKTKKGAYFFSITKKIHKIFHIRRKRPNFPVYMGSLYGSISKDGAMAIEKSSFSKFFLRRLNYTLCGEALYFQTLLKNESVPICNQTLTYSDWKSEGPKPKILDEKDYKKWGENRFFIRKLDSCISKRLLSLLGV